MTVGFHPLAERELVDASEFYEARAQGLGSRFLDAAEQAVRLLVTHPELGTPLSRTTRRIAVHRFPYVVVYRPEADHLFIVAIAHNRRRPNYWTARVR
ncbi:MAG: type II toxin-antitoxin system RelE/ParE family toxin [Gemmatimonadales bacterium]|nr:type II toxin-antitoxin system RelE/ParE family toxin [Gemmatimonadales bacterium]